MNIIDARSMRQREDVYSVAWAILTKTEKRLIQPLFILWFTSPDLGFFDKL